MPERNQLTTDEALNRLSLVAHSLAHLAESIGTDLGSLLNLLARTLEDCLAVIDKHQER